MQKQLGLFPEKLILKTVFQLVEINSEGGFVYLRFYDPTEAYFDKIYPL
ncbi:hypothetical protein N9Z08_03965 [Pirellulales bacterium]|nr:hypothetical protein [Pirellulales bacterium]MDB4366065.1 hypothetical protein [Pirellulales bacterium]